MYGASTKGNVILQYYGLDNNLITAAAEEKSEKWESLLLVLVYRSFLKKMHVKKIRLFPCTSLGFFDEFYERETEWRNNGKFIVPLSQFRVV